MTTIADLRLRRAEEEYDVVVIGASSAGVGAAVGAARRGAEVLLVEPTRRVGGMVTNGVTTDMVNRDASTGLFDEHRALVAEAYRGHPDVELTRDGLNAEPDVALTAVQTLLDHPGIEVRTGVRLDGARVADGRITEVTLTDGSTRTTARAPVFVDATAEGDLLGEVGTEGADWVVGREGRDVHGESLAPAEGDRLQQAYTYRMTVQVGGRTDYDVPDTYDEDRDRYASIERVAAEKTCTFVGDDGSERRYEGMRIQRCLPDRKMDINVDLVGMNHGYPTGTPEERAVVERRLAGFVLGYLHWLRTERGAPELGLPVDDHLDNDGFPSVLYVREGRRLRGVDTFTQRNAVHDSPWPGPHRRSVAIGEYGLDSHCVAPVGAVSGGPACEGAFWVRAKPYGVPYDVMVSERFENLLVPAAVSASHVGYSTLRMEPVRMNLGHAAGIAAVLATDDGVPVAEVDVDALQRALAEAGQALVYLEGMSPDDDDFAERQLAAVRSAPTTEELTAG